MTLPPQGVLITITEWRRSLTSEDDALELINRVGMVLLFPVKGLELPNLYEGAVDPEDYASTWWGWKDTLAATRRAFYGKIIKRKATLISLDLLPAFYRLSGRTGDLQDIESFYAGGGLSYLAKRIYDVVTELGPIPAHALRRELGVYRKGHPAYDRAMEDLQARFLVCKTDSLERGWGTDVFDLFDRWVDPSLPEAANAMSAPEAQELITARYLDYHPAATARTVDKLFGSLTAWASA